MNIIVIKDLIDDVVDMVVVSYQTNKDDIQRIIDKAKRKHKDWCIDDIERALPEDCVVVDRWQPDWNEVWY